MKKFIKFGSLILVMAIMFISSYKDYVANAQTFGELKAELAREQAALRDNEKNQNLTQNQMNTVNSNIAAVQASITKTYKDIENLNVEIEELNANIEKKQNQIKELVNYVQVSNGESSYLEYVFGANDYTDLIYRAAIAEQLSNYNSNLIDSFNKDIEDAKKKKIEIADKREELSKQQAKLQEEYTSLGSKLDEFVDVAMDIEDQIKYLQEMVDLYKEKGCKDDQDIKSCGNSLLPTNTKFFRPLVKGFVTSEYGYRTYQINGSTKSDFHSGTDMSVSPSTDVNVYAAGTGMVSGMVLKSSCGGNYVFVQHRMKDGSTYTTMYMHLAKILVSKGDIVTKDTVVGIMGGGHNASTPSNYTPWDTCTTGPHTHFTIATGLYGVDYKTWSAFMSHTFNPRNIVNMPSGRYNWFNDRLTAY